MIKLNLGCGTTKLEGYVNIDVEESCSPDLVCDFTKVALPYENDSVEEIVMFHTIEHIRKIIHPGLFGEFRRVLKVGGRLIISYPNFWECATRWKNNYQGQRDFWHATMFGRQLYPSDYHVCAMDPTEVEIILRDIGFGDVNTEPEADEPFNSITWGIKREVKTYVNQLKSDFESMKVK